MPLERFAYDIQQRLKNRGFLEGTESFEEENKHSPMLLLTPMQIYRKYFYKQQARQMKDILNGNHSILDIGSGVGYFAQAIKNELPQMEIVCTDVEASNRTDVPFILANGKDLPFKDNSFDIVTLFYVLHHTDDPKSVLREAQRISKDKVVVQEDAYTNSIQKWAYAKHIKSFVRKNPQAGVSPVRTNFDWEKMFEEEGFTIDKKRSVFRLSYPVTRTEYQLLVPDQ